MTSAQLSRASGLALATGAVVFTIHIVMRSALTAGAGGETIAFARHGLWVPVNALGVLGAVLVLAGMPAMYARMAGPGGWLGLIGVGLIALGDIGRRMWARPAPAEPAALRAQPRAA